MLFLVFFFIIYKETHDDLIKEMKGKISMSAHIKQIIRC